MIMSKLTKYIVVQGSGETLLEAAANLESVIAQTFEDALEHATLPELVGGVALAFDGRWHACQALLVARY